MYNYSIPEVLSLSMPHFISRFIMKKVAFLVDGFNLYHAIDKNFGDSKYKWLNLRKLAENLIDEDCEVARLFYFTAYVTWDKNKMERHKKYIKALSANKTEIILGKFKKVTKTIRADVMTIETDLEGYYIPNELKYCTFEEKRTDVNIAVKIIELALSGKYDEIYIVSGDSDFVPAINFVKQKFKSIKFINVLPFNSKGKDLGNVCHLQIEITEDHLVNSLLDETIKIGDELVVKPENWS